MKLGRLSLGIFILIFVFIYSLFPNIFPINIALELTNIIGALFADLIIPVLLGIFGIILIIASYQPKEQKRQHFNQQMGKTCPACGHTIPELSRKCSFCGKIQP